MMWEIAGGIVIAVLILIFWPLIVGTAIILALILFWALFAFLLWGWISSGSFDGHRFESIAAAALLCGVSIALEGWRAREVTWRTAVWVHFWALIVGVILLEEKNNIGRRSQVLTSSNSDSRPENNPFAKYVTGSAPVIASSSKPGNFFDQFDSAPSAMTPPETTTMTAPKMSPSLQGRIDNYTVEHYRKCWATALSMSPMTYVPRVEFRLSRVGALEGPPRLLNPSTNAVEKARGDQALAAVRRCSPMPILPEFAPYYDYWRVTELDMKDEM